MRVALRIPQLSSPIALALWLLLPGCLPGERANDPLPDVVADVAKADAGKSDAPGDAAKADGGTDDVADAADDATGTAQDATETEDIEAKGCLSTDDCKALPTLPCQATPTCNVGTGLCESPALAEKAPCNSDACFTGQTCDATGACVGGTVRNCDDKTECTVDLCSGGVCTHVPALVACNDLHDCTLNDHCENGGCVGTPLNCDDANPCTTDSCHEGDPSLGVMNLCQNIGFGYDPLKPVSCVGNKPGYLPFCDFSACGALKPCDDKNECTIDSNDPNGDCAYAFAGNSSCNAKDKCAPGTCQMVKGAGGVDLPACVTKAQCATTKICMTETCNPGTGACSSPTPLPAGTACGDLCTANATCDGTVKPKCNGTPLVCNDGNPCTDDSCAPATGCSAAPNSKTCNDGNACTISDACAGGLCGGATVVVDDANACTVDACDKIGGVTHKPVSDGQVCGTNSTCSKGICVAK